MTLASVGSLSSGPGSAKAASQALLAWAMDPGFAQSLSEILFGLCAIPTVPLSDIERLAAREGEVLKKIADVLSQSGLPGMIERRAIDDGISSDSRYTPVYYTDDPHPYRGRANLIHCFDPSSVGNPPAEGSSVAFNAHIDTVEPHIPPEVRNGAMYGRGSSDDKGCCVALIGASILLERLRRRYGLVPRGRVLSMFVIDEETGGNGSLSLAMDARVSKLYDSIVVAESTEGQICPANRGAVWYRLELGPENQETTLRALAVVRAFEKAGGELRREREHPLFPAKPVQTCHGILGAYGSHPSGICGEVAFEISLPEKALGEGHNGEAAPSRAEVELALNRGVAEYIADYADRTKILDPNTGAPKLERHYTLKDTPRSFYLAVFGTTGHMGSSFENDNAITKAAYLIPTLKSAFPDLTIRLAERSKGPFVLEGGQGFMPCHDIEEVKAKMSAALASVGGLPASALSFDKLHNDAFARDPESREARSAIEAATLSGIPVRLPLTGFQASCDARLFAYHRPEVSVITAGPGSLRFAHSSQEHLDLRELARSAAFYALHALLVTGTFAQS